MVVQRDVGGCAERFLWLCVEMLVILRRVGTDNSIGKFAVSQYTTF